MPHPLRVCSVVVTQATQSPVTVQQGSVSVRRDSPGRHVTASKTNTTVTIHSPIAPLTVPYLPALVVPGFMGKIWAVLVSTEMDRPHSRMISI
jgi:hypothetical protein